MFQTSFYSCICYGKLLGSGGKADRSVTANFCHLENVTKRAITICQPLLDSVSMFLEVGNKAKFKQCIEAQELHYEGFRYSNSDKSSVR